MIKEIVVRYCEINEKYDAYIDGEWVGKFYTLDGVIKRLTREAR